MLDIEAPNVDSARMRRAGKELLSLALMDSRNHTLRWITALRGRARADRAERAAAARAQPAAVVARPPRLVPGALDRAQRAAPARRALRPVAAAAGLDRAVCRRAGTTDARVTHGARWQICAAATLQATRQYLVDTLETTLELLDTAPDDDDDALYFFRLALFHEDMHVRGLRRHVADARLRRRPAASPWAVAMRASRCCSRPRAGSSAASPAASCSTTRSGRTSSPCPSSRSTPSR